MEPVKLGELIFEGQMRDAVHVAVFPARAGEDLMPGQDVGFIGVDNETVGQSDNPFGIVDPYLQRGLEAGERFWVCLYPGSTTSLSHVWTSDSVPVPAGGVINVAASREWVTNFAHSIGQTYESLMEAGDRWVLGHNYTYDNSQGYGHADWEDWDVFWRHYTIITGRAYHEGGHPFTCSC